MKTFKQKYIVLSLVFCSLMFSSLAVAAVVYDVTNTSHNLATGPGKVASAASGVTQICIFCHTPHNAVKSGPLWNKAGLNTPVVFKMYTSSASLSSAAKASSLPANSPSLLCLSCHDGKTAMNILHNTSYGVDISATGVPTSGAGSYPAGTKVIDSTGGLVAYAMPAPQWDFGAGDYTAELRIGGVSGTDLTNDHPIGFSYSDAYNEKLAKGATLKNYVGMDPAVRLFGANKRVECSSCHNPHIDTAASGPQVFTSFLVKSNEGSALCLTCHDK